MKTFIRYFLISLLVLGGLFASVYFLLLPRQLGSYSYTSEQVALIREKGLVYEFLQTGKSTLMSMALNSDQKNIDKLDLYLVSDSDLPEGIDFEALYGTMDSLDRVGYTKEEITRLVNNISLDELHILTDNPLPAQKDVLFTALDKKYNVIQAYQLANIDRNLSDLIINENTDYTITLKLSNMGYAVDEIKTLNKLSSADLTLVTLMKYLEDLPDLVANDEFDLNLLPRYLIVMEDRGYDAEGAVAYVNGNEDYVDADDIDYYGLYSDDFRVENPYSLTAMVNKNHYLSSDYAPTDLTEFSHEEMRSEVATALASLFTALNDQGFETIIVDVGYISYSEQDELFNRYLEMFDDDEEKALERAPYAGYSEHQTGLAVDLYARGGTFDEYDGYQWLLENAQNYGFILRYPAGKEYLTGCVSEPKHFRYVGVEAARIMYSHDWTLEEYNTVFE